MFKINLSFVCSTTREAVKGSQVANIFHARCVILTTSVYSLVITRESGKVIGMPGPEMKK